MVVTGARWSRFAVFIALTLGAAGQDPPTFAPAPADIGLNPQRLETYGKTHYWQLAEEPVAGTMVLIHGCGPAARAFFPYDPSVCPECQGLPEYLSQTKQALARGYHVLALSANDGWSNCWSSSTKNGRVDDRPDVVATVRAFLRNHSATELPLYFQGYSSGATMCLKLPSYLKEAKADLRIDGIVAVDGAPRGGFNAEDRDRPGRLARGLTFPPTVFVVAQYGGSWERAPGQIEFLRSNRVPADMIVSQRRQITPSYFSDRISTVTRPQSEELVAALRELGGLDPSAYLLPVWGLDQAAARLPWLREQRVWDAVVTQMHVAAGNHENLGEFTTASLAWLESEGEADLAELRQELAVPRPGELTIDGWPVDAPAPTPAVADNYS